MDHNLWGMRRSYNVRGDACFSKCWCCTGCCHRHPQRSRGTYRQQHDTPAVHNPRSDVSCRVSRVGQGVCVAVPIYFASGSRWSGFLWSLVAAVAEPLGALVGYAIIRISSNSDGHVHPNVYGSLFGIVAGIMVRTTLAAWLVGWL